MKPNCHHLGRVAILFFALTIVSGGCNYDALVNPVPPISLKFGYMGLVSDGFWTFVPFSSQQKISFDSLQFHTQNSIVKGLMVRLDEYGVKCQTIKFRSGSDDDAEVMNNVIFVFQVGSNDDKEIFATNKNGWKAGYGGGSDENNINCAIDVDYLMPIKLFADYSSLRVAGNSNNDTLEVHAPDTIKISYRSLYTSQSISASLIVK